jgi:hypothetical protein
MELVSMLAGEPFSDAPLCACPIIGAFLRAYNDAIDDDRRQDLYRCAALVVGTATPDAHAIRADMCLDEAATIVAEMPTWKRRLRGFYDETLWRRGITDAEAARLTAKLLARAGSAGHERALALVDRLVAAAVPRATVAEPIEPPVDTAHL